MKDNSKLQRKLAVGLSVCLGVLSVSAQARTEFSFGVAVPGVVVQAGQGYGADFGAYPSYPRYPNYPTYTPQPAPLYQSNPFPAPLYSNAPPPQVGYGTPYYPPVYVVPPAPVYVAPPPVYYNRGYYQRNYYDSGRHGHPRYHDWR